MTGKTLIAVAAVLLLAAGCSDDPAPAPLGPTESSVEPSPVGLGAAAEACEDLTDPEARLLSLTRDGGVLDDEVLGSWGVLVHAIGVRASESPDEYVSIQGQAIVDYIDDMDGQFTRSGLYNLAYGLFEACRFGYIDRGMVAVPWPSEEAIQGFFLAIALTGDEGGLITEDSPAFALGLESCQTVADEHNRTGAMPDREWLLDKIDTLTDSEGIGMSDSMAVVVGGISSFCPEYKRIIQDA